MDITQMNETELYKLGQEIAEAAINRPDAVHRIVLGMKHAFERHQTHPHLQYPQLGELLHGLWRHAWFTLDPKTLSIQFHPMNEVPSGSGHLKP